MLVRAVELTVDFPFGKAERRRPPTGCCGDDLRCTTLVGLYFGAEPDFSQPGLLTPSATPGSTTNLNTRAMEQTQQVRTYEHTLHYPGSEWDTGGGWLDLRVSKTLFPLNASSVRVRGTLAHATRCATRPRCAYADTPSTSSGLATCKGVVCSLTRGFDRRGVCGVPDTTENERTNGQQAS